MLKRYFFVLILSVCVSGLNVLRAQDTLTMMHYNLTNYGSNASTSYCTEQNNSLVSKEANLRTIIAHVRPHIFTANEVSANPVYTTRLLSLVLNSDTRTQYAAATPTNISVSGFPSSIINGFFYDSTKLVLHTQRPIRTSLRDQNYYKLYYKSNTLVSSDTVFLQIVVMHLKSGSASADANRRAQLTKTLTDTLSNWKISGNLIVSGDFNTYNSNEVGFQNLINSPNLRIRLQDPINSLGSWTNNSAFSNVHTQSTQSSGNGCLASSGLDDRFDFILFNRFLGQDSGKIGYVSGSYKAVGQDGLRYNMSINSPANTAVSSAVADALFNMSDHLPVTARFRVGAMPLSAKNPYRSSKGQNGFSISVNNQNQLLLWPQKPQSNTEPISYQIYTSLGVLVQQGTAKAGLPYSIDLKPMPQGVYLIATQTKENMVAHQLFVVK